MGMAAPMVIFATILAMFAVGRNHVNMITPAPASLQMNSDAGAFLAYRSAVLSYMQANPTFTGSVPLTTLQSYGNGQFASLSGAGNFVSATGTAARLVTCWASVSTGTVQQAVSAAGVDASIGTSNGTTWTTAAPGVTPAAQSLNTAVAAGDIVSVFKIGT